MIDNELKKCIEQVLDDFLERTFKGIFSDKAIKRKKRLAKKHKPKVCQPDKLRVYCYVENNQFGGFRIFHKIEWDRGEKKRIGYTFSNVDLDSKLMNDIDEINELTQAIFNEKFAPYYRRYVENKELFAGVKR